ncbi:FG-GAP repeat domain-containing protein [Spirosoma rhododendri]|uniref:VCBS repeat-containing protein n=1 Tax=Spirosoma rhododendri TaxID=2728024 RepID=A0A7L5DLI3_9BACT|nr:VCBS repeat-containing protein [Spirosoma rhododendri]QJD78955.1 VCBS repeat-containing protein [Spirosoma rhododendri]
MFKPTILYTLAILGLLTGCQSSSETTNATVGDPVATEGEALAKQYCGSCHLPVSPAMLDKTTWKNQVLPAMAPKLGLEVWQKTHYFRPASASISQTDWDKLRTYYETLAPDSLHPASDQTKSADDWAGFSLLKPGESTGNTATTTMVAFDPAQQQVYSSNETDAGLYRWGRNLKPERLRTLPSPAVQARFINDNSKPERIALTCIGTMLAVDQPAGQLIELAPDQANDPTVLTQQLPRPIESTPGDFNHDGLTDWLVCGFGHNMGGLYLLRQRPDHQFDKQVIRNVAGATQVITGDFNRDGWLDCMALFAHADEGIWLFTNDQHGGFTERMVLRFPPVYGSTSFQLIDMNRDGRLDIIYTAGDNSDYSRILKPYHGIYIFLNDGHDQYKQQTFLPLNGCTKAVAADFDKDGDLDIAAIAFFADLGPASPQTFVYYEGQPAQTFRRHHLPISQYGRWICMDVNDWDHDGNLDIALGNFSRGFLNSPAYKPTYDSYLPLIVLQNNAH